MDGSCSPFQEIGFVGTVLNASLSTTRYGLRRPILARFEFDGGEYTVDFPDADLAITDRTLEEAVDNLKSFIAETYEDLASGATGAAEATGERDARRRAVLDDYIVGRDAVMA